MDALREHLGITGPKKGCDHGQCGACTILVAGRRINSCLALAVAYAGDQIVTIEGLACADDLHPLQRAFIEHDAFQCGYCTPGQICSAVGMLHEFQNGWPSAVTSDLDADHSDLTEDEIRERMSGNLCRCGGSMGTASWGSAIVDAARKLRARLRDECDGVIPDEGLECTGEVTNNPEAQRFAMHAFGA